MTPRIIPARRNPRDLSRQTFTTAFCCVAPTHRESNQKSYTTCIAACPNCMNWCSLNQGHYGPHRCSNGHEWN